MFGVCYPEFRLPGGPFVLPSTTPTQFDPAAFVDSLDLLADYSPEKLYLTHFGELAWAEASRQLLLRQVKRYPELAREAGADVAALTETLTDYTWGELGPMVPEQSRERVRERLLSDLGLNAQGLSIWLQRQAA